MNIYKNFSFEALFGGVYLVEIEKIPFFMKIYKNFSIEDFLGVSYGNWKNSLFMQM
jgi:hypothetical protein